MKKKIVVRNSFNADKNKNIYQIQHCVLHVVGFKLCASLPEDGQGRLKNVAISFGFNKFVIFDGIK